MCICDEYDIHGIIPQMNHEFGYGSANDIFRITFQMNLIGEMTYIKRCIIDGSLIYCNTLINKSGALNILEEQVIDETNADA